MTKHRAPLPFKPARQRPVRREVRAALAYLLYELRLPSSSPIRRRARQKTAALKQHLHALLRRGVKMLAAWLVFLPT
jgi:hypothetical protein